MSLLRVPKTLQNFDALSCNCLSACHYLYSPLRCELLQGINWLFNNSGSLAPRVCNKNVLSGWVRKSNHLHVCLPSLYFQPSGPGPDCVSLLRLKMMTHVTIQVEPHSWPQSALNLPLPQVPSQSAPLPLSHAQLLQAKTTPPFSELQHSVCWNLSN